MRVNNFTIGNQHGKIIFKGLTDVSGIDISKIVEINNGSVQLYKSHPKPEKGKELNKPALIHLYNCNPSDDE